MLSCVSAQILDKLRDKSDVLPNNKMVGKGRQHDGVWTDGPIDVYDSTTEAGGTDYYGNYQDTTTETNEKGSESTITSKAPTTTAEWDIDVDLKRDGGTIMSRQWRPGPENQDCPSCSLVHCVSFGCFHQKSMQCMSLYCRKQKCL